MAAADVSSHHQSPSSAFGQHQAPPNNVYVQHHARDRGENGAMQAANHPPRHWVPSGAADHRDGFIAWLKGEFAAANAIIDALCHHLQCLGEDEEYDTVWSCVQQRRHNWAGLLYMQQFFSVAEVVNSLQHVAWMKQQQQHHHDHHLCPPPAHHLHQQGHAQNLSPIATLSPHCGEGLADQPVAAIALDEEKALAEERNVKPEEGSVPSGHEYPRQNEDSPNQALSAQEQGLMDTDIQFMSNDKADSTVPIKKSKKFDWSESLHGKMVNTGIDVYENVFSSAELSSITNLIYEIQNVGHQGKLGNIFMVQKSSSGVKETLRFSAALQHSLGKDEVQPMPKFLQSMIDWLAHNGIFSSNTRPDLCIISIFEEGCIEPPEIEQCGQQQVLCILSVLGDCKLVFGHPISMDQSGECDGPLQIALTAGSLLYLRESNAALLKRAVPALSSKRVTIVFEKVLDSIDLNAASKGATEGPQHVAQGKTRKAPFGGMLNCHGGNMDTFNHHQPDMQTNIGVIPLSSLHLMPTQTHHIVPQHTISGMQQPPFPPTFTGQLGPYSPLSVVAAPKLPNSGTGVFFPSSDASGGPVAVPSWQSGLLVLSPFSPKSTNSFRAPMATELRRSMHVRRPPRHVNQYSFNQVKSKGNAGLLTPQRKLERQPMCQDVDAGGVKEGGEN